MSFDEPSAVGGELRRSIAEAGQRIDSIIDVAEQAAAEIRAHARAEVDAYRLERRRDIDRELGERVLTLERLIEPLSKRIEALRGDADGVVGELDKALGGLRELARVEAPADASPPAEETAPPVATSEPPVSPPIAASPPERAPARPRFAGTGNEGYSGPRPVAYPGRAAPPLGGRREEGILRATQLAINGTPRNEIASRLRQELGLSDTAEVLNAVLGPEAA